MTDHRLPHDRSRGFIAADPRELTDQMTRERVIASARGAGMRPDRVMALGSILEEADATRGGVDRWSAVSELLIERRERGIIDGDDDRAIRAFIDAAPWLATIDGDPAEEHRAAAGHAVARRGDRWTCDRGDAGDPSLYAELFDAEAFTS